MRQVFRKMGMVMSGLMVMGLVAAGSAHAVSLTFENVPGGSIQDSYGDMPTYNGFDFSSTLDWIDVESPSWPYGAHSGDFVILNNNGGTGIITEQSGADFTFDGLWAKAWATSPESGGPDVVFGFLSGHNNGNLVWSMAPGLNGSYKFFGPQPGAIDGLILSFPFGILVDDISLNAGLASVPEASTLLLLALGLAGLAAWRSRAQRI